MIKLINWIQLLKIYQIVKQVGRYYTPVLGGSYLFEYRLKRSTLWGAQVKGCDLVVNT